MALELLTSKNKIMKIANIANKVGAAVRPDSEFITMSNIVDRLAEAGAIEKRSVKTHFDQHGVEYTVLNRSAFGLTIEVGPSAGSAHRHSPGRLRINGVEFF